MYFNVSQSIKALHELRESFDVVDVRRSSEAAVFPDDLVPGLRPAFEAAAELLTELNRRILRALSAGLGLEDIDHFVSIHSKIRELGTMSKLRSIFYPPVPGTLYTVVVPVFSLLMQTPPFVGGLAPNPRVATVVYQSLKKSPLPLVRMQLCQASNRKFNFPLLHSLMLCVCRQTRSWKEEDLLL